MTTLHELLHHRLVAIIRGADPASVLPIAESLYVGGIRAVEVTLNSPQALEQIRLLTQAMAGRMLVGAGTVLDAAAAAQAIDAGARFIISPSVDTEVIACTKQKGVVSIPGAYTPTEILTAWKAGGDIIKVFPAGSPQYIKDLRGPLDHIPLMPTGGVGIDNIQAFQKAGAVAFGIGSALVDSREPVNDTYLEQLTQKAASFVQTLTNR